MLSQKEKKFLAHKMYKGGIGPTEVAKHVGMSTATIMNLVKEERIPYIRNHTNINAEFDRIVKKHTKKHLNVLVGERLIKEFGGKVNAMISRVMGFHYGWANRKQKDTDKKGIGGKTVARKIADKNMVEEEYKKKLKQLKKLNTEQNLYYLLVDEFYRQGFVGGDRLLDYLTGAGIKVSEPGIDKMLNTGTVDKNGRITTRKPWFNEKLVDHKLVDKYVKKIQNRILDKHREYFIVDALKVVKPSPVKVFRFFQRCPKTKEVNYGTLKDWLAGTYSPIPARPFIEEDFVKKDINQILNRTEVEERLHGRIKTWPKYVTTKYLHSFLSKEHKKWFSEKDIEKVLKESPLFKKTNTGLWRSIIKRRNLSRLESEKTLTRKEQEVLEHRLKYTI